MQATKEVNPTPLHCTMCPYVECHLIFILRLLLLLMPLMLMHAYICHIAHEGQVEWTTPTEVSRECLQLSYCHMLH